MLTTRNRGPQERSGDGSAGEQPDVRDRAAGRCGLGRDGPLALACGVATTSAGRLEPGALLPGFRLFDQDRRLWTEEDLRDRRSVLYFYPADGTPGCTAEAAEFEALAGDFQALGVTILGISPDSIESHQRFRAAQGLHFDLLSDPERTLVDACGAYGTRTLYGRPVTGVLRSSLLVGPDLRVERAWYNVRAHGHAARVLAALRP